QAASRFRFVAFDVKEGIGGALADVVEAERVFQFGVGEEGKDFFAVLVLAIEVGGHVVFQFGRDELLAVVVPIGIDADEQVGFFPVDGVAVDVALAGAGGV